MKTSKATSWLWGSLKKGVLVAIVLRLLFAAGSWLSEQVFAFKAKFPGHEALALSFLPLAILLLGWLAPKLRHLVAAFLLRRFGPPKEEALGLSWVGKEVEYAPYGTFESGPPDIKYKGLVTAEKTAEDGVVYLRVVSVFPPGATSNFPEIRKDSAKVRLTGRGAEDYGLTVITLGRL